MKFHLGTIGILTFFKLLFKPIRFFTRPLYSSLASANQKNFFIRFLQVACIPCIWLHHKLIRYLTKSAFIQMNMWSTKYSVASQQSYYLAKVRHGDRGEGNEELIEFVLRNLKFSISLLGSLLFYLYADFIPYSPLFKNISDVADPLVGSIIVFFFGMFVSSAYTSTYDMVIKTIVQCHFMDEEMHVGDQVFTEPIFDELMGYWKRPEDDNGLNADAQKTKKKDVKKEKADIDELYRVVPDGDEEEGAAPESEEEDAGQGDLYTEKKRKKFNKEQDFDDQFIISKHKSNKSLVFDDEKKPLTRQLAKPKDDHLDEGEAIFIDDYDDEPKNIDVKQKHKDLKDIPLAESQEWGEENPSKPGTIIFKTEKERDDETKGPKSILKSHRHMDDNMSMKSSISKRKKFTIKDNKTESAVQNFEVEKPEPNKVPQSGIIFKVNDDDNKSMKSSRSKKKRGETDKSPAPHANNEKPERVVVFQADENKDLEQNKKPDNTSVMFRANEDDDNKSMKSNKSKLSKRSLKTKKKDLGNEKAEEEKPNIFIAKPEADNLRARRTPDIESTKPTPDSIMFRNKSPIAPTPNIDEEMNEGPQPNKHVLTIKKRSDSKALNLPQESTLPNAVPAKINRRALLQPSLDEKGRSKSPIGTSENQGNNLARLQQKERDDMEADNNIDDNKSSKSKKIKGFLNKHKEQKLDQPTVNFRVNEEDDKMSHKLSVKSKKKAAREMSENKDRPKNNNQQNSLVPTRRNDVKRDAGVEDDFESSMKDVMDKGKDIQILNASQGQSMLSKGSKKKGKDNPSQLFRFKDDSDEGDDNYF